MKSTETPQTPTGILICNIGTPKSFQVEDVKEYLSEFLMDKDVISLPWILRYPLVQWLIVPRRGPFSAEKYKAVWMQEGSPLLVLTERFTEKLQMQVGRNFLVRTAMRYSVPNIRSAMAEMKQKGITEVIAAPMFPQFAQATTGSFKRYVLKLNKEFGFKIKFIPDFYNHPHFIDSFATIIKENLTQFKFDHLLFSYHGLPESQIKKVSPQCLTSPMLEPASSAPVSSAPSAQVNSAPSAQVNSAPSAQVNSAPSAQVNSAPSAQVDRLNNPNCCARPEACAQGCYRAQCLKTTELIANHLGLASGSFSSSFQSRLGRAKWIGPATDQVIGDLAKSGVKNLAVVCPSFVTDCIETIEEIGIEGRSHFESNGGRQLKLIPCLNDHQTWINGFSSMISR